MSMGEVHLPSSWATIPLGELRSKTKAVVPAETPSQIFALYSVPSHPARKPEIVKGHDVGSNKQCVDPGMTLLCKINPRINRVWVVANEDPGVQIASTEWICFARSEFVIPRYLHYYMQQTWFRDHLAQNVSGVGGSLTRTRPAVVDPVELSLAPLKEQARITEEIEKQFSRLDAAQEALNRVKENLKRYRASVLKSATEGRLVPTEAELARTEEREYETGDQLLQRILIERRKRWEEAELEKMIAKGKPPKNDKWKSRYKEPPAPDALNLPALPEGWTWATIEQLASGVANAMTIGPFGSDLKVSDYRSHGVKLVFVRNIRSQSFEDDNAKHVSDSKARQLRRHLARPDDLLITKMGDPPGDACIFPSGLDPAIITADCIKVTLAKQGLNSRWIESLFSDRIVQNQILTRTQGVAQKKVSLSRFKSLVVPLPPPIEQNRIMSIVDVTNSKINSLAEDTGRQTDKLNLLRSSILRSAFTGQLVAQDPLDEPASALLERNYRQKKVTASLSKRSTSAVSS